MTRPQTVRPIVAIADARPTMMAFWRKDLTCAFANGPYGHWFGRTVETMIDMRMQDLLGADLFALNEPSITAALAGEEQRFERELVRADGSVGHLLTNYVPQCDCEGVIAGFAAFLTDVTASREAEGELRMAASALASMVQGITISGMDGVILSVNPAFTDITGYSSGEAVGRSSRFLGIDRQDEQLRAAVAQEIEAKGCWRGELWSRRKNGEAFLGQQTTTLVRGPDGEPIHTVSVFIDVTDVWQRNELLRHQALHDALTDLPNRSVLMERLDLLASRAPGPDGGFAVVFIDLDEFKSVNDRHGHFIGDRVLTTVARRLRSAVRGSDLVSRLAGDEFVVVLDGAVRSGDIEATAERILASLGEPMPFADALVRITASLGVARYPADGQDGAGLLACADAAMYAAKQSKGGVCLYDVSSRLMPAR